MTNEWIECTDRLPDLNTPVLIRGRDGMVQEAILTAGGYWNLDGHLEPPGYAVAWKAQCGGDSCPIFYDD